MAVRTLRLAHRGDWRRAPENTVAALLAAVSIPACDGLEFDVRASADGIPVIYHDATLERLHGRPDPVGVVPAAALARLGVPTLAEVLASVGRRPFLDVELKADVGPIVVQVLAAGRGRDLTNAVVSSFDRAALERIAHLAPAWPRWLNSHRLDAAVVATAVGLGCRGVSVDWRVLDQGSVGLAKDAGLDVVAFTVRRRSTFDRLARLGLTAVCVEGPALDG